MDNHDKEAVAHAIKLAIKEINWLNIRVHDKLSIPSVICTLFALEEALKVVSDATEEE